MPPAGGKRYLTSTAVFLNEVVKLGIALTMALYDVSKTAPSSMPATSLFSSLTNAVFSGDSWKLAIPAGLGVLSNSLQYIALSNMRAATFQVSFQLQFLTTAIFGLIVLRRSIAPRKWGLLLLLLVGVALVQIPDANSEQVPLQEDGSSLHFPRSLEEWKAVKGAAGSLRKRSATYEGIEEDIQTADPRLNAAVGLLAIIGAALASGFSGVYFEKVLKDSSNHTSIWVRNVQLAVYSVFPALFIGVVFRDGDTIANEGFFQGYNWAVWATVAVQAIGGILSTFSISHAQRDARCLATTASIIASVVGSVWLFDFELTTSVSLDSICPFDVVSITDNQISSSWARLQSWSLLITTATLATARLIMLVFVHRPSVSTRTKRTVETVMGRPLHLRRMISPSNSQARRSCRMASRRLGLRPRTPVSPG